MKKEEKPQPTEKSRENKTTEKRKRENNGEKTGKHCEKSIKKTTDKRKTEN